MATVYSNDTAIKRFTYDWLIRFAELHPFIHDLDKDLPNDLVLCLRYKQMNIVCNEEELNRVKVLPEMGKPVRSKYARISPRFFNLLTRYMPNLFYEYDHRDVTESKLEQQTKNSNKNHKIFISDYTWFVDLTPGTLTRLINNRYMFYTGYFDFNGSENTVSPKELINFLKCSHFHSFLVTLTLTEPMMFSEICPLIAHGKLLSLDINNLIYDKNIAHVLRENRPSPKVFELCNLDISDEALLEVVDYFLALPTPPKKLKLFFKQTPHLSLHEAVKDKLNRSGRKNVVIFLS